MDAYDIFKKLTKGLKFKNRVIGVHNNLKKQSLEDDKLKKDVLEIKKEELCENEEDLGVNEDESDTHSQSDSADSDGPKDEDLQIIEGVNIEKKKKKKKKEKTEDFKKKLEQEEHNQFRNEYGIKAVGRHIPAALKDFSDLQSRYIVSESLVNIVKKCGYTEPTPIQRQALPCMLEDRQILACAPTGSGKTAAFLLPILHTLGAPRGGPRALVLCPTRELAVQIYNEALRLSEGTELRCSVVRKMQESKIKERESTIRKSDIVISTPNRLCYLLNQDNVNINLDKVRWLVIDEADKLFEGSAEQEADFRQQIDQIMQACSSRERRVCLFSATHAARVAQWARRSLRGIINVTVGNRNAAASTVQQELLYCGSESGKLIAFRQLVRRGLTPPVLVFVQSKDRAKQLFKELIYDGINVDVIHADRTQAQRDNVVRSFRVGRIWVLICTELLGRGMDFRGVSLVVNYDFPPSAVAYIHRIGRAGRAGQKGKAITFFTQDDVVNLRSIAAVMKQSGCEVPAYMLQLRRDAAARRRLLRRAPNRDDISTVVGKKRKLEDDKENNANDKTTEKVTDSKHKKQRKTESQGSPGRPAKFNKHKKGNNEDSKNNKQGGNKNKQRDNKVKKDNKKGKVNKKQKQSFVPKKGKKASKSG